MGQAESAPAPPPPVAFVRPLATLQALQMARNTPLNVHELWERIYDIAMDYYLVPAAKIRRFMIRMMLELRDVHDPMDLGAHRYEEI